MKLIILAGGEGTRLGLINLPKPMVLINNKPIIEHQIEQAKLYGLTDIILLIGYKGEKISDYFQNGEKWGVNIRYFSDPHPLGTAGSMKIIETYLDDDFIVFYGDIIFNINLDCLIKFHQKKHPIATLVAHPNDHPFDSDLLGVNDNNKIISFFPKSTNANVYRRNLANAALYILSPKIFQYINKNIFMSLETDVFPKMLEKKEELYAYITTEYIKDIGTIDRLNSVESDYLKGKIKNRNKKQLQRAIFLDRDGVINKDVSGSTDLSKFQLYPKVPESIKLINKSNFLTIVVTNQPNIAKGITSIQDVNDTHNYMEFLIGKQGAYFDHIFFCPHHNKKGFKGENIKYKINCKCRKPAIGMIEKACNIMNIDLSISFIIGDRSVDIQTGINAGLETILLKTGENGKDGKYNCLPDYEFDTLYQSINFIVNIYDKLYNQIHSLISKILNTKLNRIILIGGLSQSGKSIFSKVLSKVFINNGFNIKYLSLNNWILREDKRNDKETIRERYQYKKLTNDLQNLINHKTIKINQYDLFSRKSSDKMIEFNFDENDILIIDGVISLDIELLRNLSNYKFYIEVKESERKNRFFNFHKQKGLNYNEIKILYKQKVNDENDTIINSKHYADHIIKMDEYNW